MELIIRASDGTEIIVPLSDCKPTIDADIKFEDVIDRFDHSRIYRFPVLKTILHLTVSLTPAQAELLAEIERREHPFVPLLKDTIDKLP